MSLGLKGLRHKIQKITAHFCRVSLTDHWITSEICLKTRFKQFQLHPWFVLRSTNVSNRCTYNSWLNEKIQSEHSDHTSGTVHSWKLF